MRVSPLLARQLLVPILGLCSVACHRDNDYDTAVTWLINGLAPDASLCRSYGVATVQFSLQTSHGDRSLSSGCTQHIFLSDGYEYGGFYPSRSFHYDVVYGYHVEMLDAKGKVVAVGGTPVRYDGSFQAHLGDAVPVELPPLELFSPQGDQATLRGSYQVGTGEVAAGCQQAGISTVEVWVASVTDTKLEDAVPVLSADCAQGALSSKTPVLAMGDYQAEYVGLDESGKVVSRSDVYSVQVSGPSDVELPEGTLNVP